MSSTSDSLKEGLDGSHALGWGESGGVLMEEGLEGNRQAASQIGEEAWWLWFSGGREFETRQWRELVDSGILIDLSFGESRVVSSGVV
jgi:hypothetical protein